MFLVIIPQNALSPLAKFRDAIINHPLIIVLILALLALGAYGVGNLQNSAKKTIEINKYKRQQNKAIKRETKKISKEAYSIVGEIMSLLDSRMAQDPYPDTLNQIREQYSRVQQELNDNTQIDVDLSYTLRMYYQTYQDQSSRLVQRMRDLNRVLGFEY